MSIKKNVRYLLELEPDIDHFFDKPVSDYHQRIIDKKHVRHYLYSDLYKYAEIIDIVNRYSCVQDSLLDVGIAYGFYDIVLKEKYGLNDIVGMDIGENISVYGRLLEKYTIPVLAGNLQEKTLPFENDRFDLVIFSEVLEHLDILPEELFAELRRILKPGGRLLLTTPNVARIGSILKLILGKNILEQAAKDSCPAHVREYTMRECQALLEVSGFRVEKKYFSNCWDKPNKFLGKAGMVYRLRNWFFNLFPQFRGNLVILTRKQP